MITVLEMYQKGEKRGSINILSYYSDYFNNLQ